MNTSIQVPSTLITIDSETTRDIDDAIAVQRFDDGGYRVVVCIADPTKLVPVGSTEDENARLLGSTVYVRDRAVRKMLPAEISEFRSSMVAGKPRSCFAFEILLGADLSVTKTTLARQQVTVSHRLSYGDIAAIMTDGAHALRPAITVAADLANGLLERRRSKGAMVLYDLARMLFMDEEGRLVEVAAEFQTAG